MTRSLIVSTFVLGLLLQACGTDVPEEGSPTGFPGTSGGTSSGSSGSSGSSSGSEATDGTGSGAGSGAGTPLSSTQTTGIATFYDYSGSAQVACAFPVTSDTNITAMNDAEYAASAACGSCLKVSGPKGTITVRVVDRCPGCAKNHIDLSAQAFAKIADPIAGRVPITYQLVACAVTGNMSYHYKEGSSKFWTAIQVRNHRVPITKVEYKKNGIYTPMTRSTYNYFIDTKGIGDQPNGLALKVTSLDGQVIEETIANVQPDKLVVGTKQFN